MFFTTRGGTRPAARYTADLGRQGSVAVSVRTEPVPIRSRTGTATAFRDRPRRILNVIAALSGLIVLAPVMLVVAILVRLTSPGPVFFSQTRVGLDRRHEGVGENNWRRHVDHGGRLFRIYKFRTMRAAEGDRQVWASPNDPRVTPVGRVLRRYRLDELPQLINVLKGDMNIVGPRPEQPAIFAVLRERVEHYRRRQKVLPGITGLAQINQPYDTSTEDVRHKLRYDLEYVGRRSIVEDLKIMVRTVPVIVFRKGAW